MRPLRFAIAGTGAIARAYEAAFSELPSAKIVGVCDVQRPAAQE
jgi:predicted dehydrogenase